MKLNRKILAGILKTLAAVVNQRPINPIAGNIAMAEKNGRLICSAQSMASQLTIATQLPVETGFQITVQGRKIYDVISSMESDEVDLHLEDHGKMTIKSGRSRFSLATLPLEGYPFFQAAKSDDATDITFAVGDLISALEKVLPASAKGDTRTFLNGIYLDANESQTVFVATDGHHLHRLLLPISSAKPIGAIIPVGEVPHLIALLKEYAEGDVIVRISPTSLAVRMGNTLLMSQLLDGRYPDYSRVIPDLKTPHWFSTNRESLSGLLRLAMIGPAEPAPVGTFDTTDDPVIRTQSENGESFVGNLQTEGQVVAHSQSFKLSLLKPAIESLEGDSVTFQMGHEMKSPLLIQESNFLAVIMPYQM